MHRLFRFLLVLILISPLAANANVHEEDTHNEDTHAMNADLSDEDVNKERNGEFVKHHTKDSHDFGLLVNESENKHYGFPLPVILYDEGVHFFWSSEFDHGHAVVESNGMYYSLNTHDAKIYKTDEHGNILTEEVVTKHTENETAADGTTHEVITEEIAIVQLRPWDFSITKNVFVTMMMCVLMFFLFKGIAKSYRTGLAPTGAAKFFEPIILFIRDDIARPNIGEKEHKRYMAYLLTVFFFIWFLNLAGMTPLGINVTGNLALTAGLALITFFITTFTGNKNYWMHIFWMPGVPVPMKIILIPIELIGMVVKPFALMIRLYANMLAGHIVLGMLIVAVYTFSNVFAQGAFVGLTFFMNIIELLVAVLQAYIFTMLTALYFGSASAKAEHH
ncbi:MAG: F0F1 ATP synthase subunit A [Crocinitomicaceae bacterium]|nr:F0F1 ATP synthase subunit A [Crocinitomicaceae bacterium]